MEQSRIYSTDSELTKMLCFKLTFKRFELIYIKSSANFFRAKRNNLNAKMDH